MNYSYRPEFIKKSAAEFRKSFPDFAEIKIKTERKQHSMFMGFDLLKRFNIPDEIKNKASRAML